MPNVFKQTHRFAYIPSRLAASFLIAFEEGRCSRLSANCFSDTPGLHARI